MTVREQYGILYLYFGVGSPRSRLVWDDSLEVQLDNLAGEVNLSNVWWTKSSQEHWDL